MPARTPGFNTTIGALALGQIVCWAVLYYAFSAFVLPMQRELGWSAPLLTGAFTSGLLVSAVAGFAVGAAIDQGHGRSVMTVGPLLGAAGLVLWSSAREPAVFYAAWLLLGVAIAMTLYEPAFAVITRRFPQRYGDGITTVTLVGGLASTLAFPAVAALQSWLGWRGALLALALVVAAMALLHYAALAGPSLTAAPPQRDEPDEASLRDALGRRSFWMLGAMFCLYSFVAGALWGHMAPALAEKGLDETRSLAVLVWFGPAQVAGRLVLAVWARRVGLRAIGLVMLAGLPLACMLFASGRSVAALIVFAVLFGLANGSATLVRGGLLPQYFGRRAIGRIGGMIGGAGQFARATAPLAAAALLGWLDSYAALMHALAATALLGWIGFLAAGRPRPQR
jgi:cyanate permease